MKVCSPVLKWVAEVYTVCKPEVGRFFISDNRAFWKNIEREEVQFVQWNFGEEQPPEAPEAPQFRTVQEFRDWIEGNRRRAREDKLKKRNK